MPTIRFFFHFAAYAARAKYARFTKIRKSEGSWDGEVGRGLVSDKVLSGFVAARYTQIV